MKNVLSYSSGRLAPGYGILKLALGLGLFPIVCGISIALLFVTTEWERLKAASFLCIMGGGMLVLIAIGLLLVHAAEHSRFGLRSRGSVIREVLLVILVLALNLPAVALCLWMVRPTLDRYELTITNGLPVSVDQVDVTVTSLPVVSVGPLAPGATVTQRWRLTGEHTVTVRTGVDHRVADTVINSHLKAGFGPVRQPWTITSATTQPVDRGRSTDPE